MPRFHWSAAALEFMLRLVDNGQGSLAERIVQETVRRLEHPPRGHRRVRIRQPGGRRRSQVQVTLLHKRRLPFLVYYRYLPADDVVEVVALRHGRQRPIIGE